MLILCWWPVVQPKACPNFVVSPQPASVLLLESVKKVSLSCQTIDDDPRGRWNIIFAMLTPLQPQLCQGILHFLEFSWLPNFFCHQIIISTLCWSQCFRTKFLPCFHPSCHDNDTACGQCPNNDVTNSMALWWFQWFGTKIFAMLPSFMQKQTSKTSHDTCSQCPQWICDDPMKSFKNPNAQMRRWQMLNHLKSHLPFQWLEIGLELPLFLFIILNFQICVWESTTACHLSPFGWVLEAFPPLLRDCEDLHEPHSSHDTDGMRLSHINREQRPQAPWRTFVPSSWRQASFAIYQIHVRTSKNGNPTRQLGSYVAWNQCICFTYDVEF